MAAETPADPLGDIIAEYESYHRNPVNRFLHMFGIPLVLTSVVGAVWKASNYVHFPVILLAILAATLWYVRLGGLMIGTLMALIFALAGVLGSQCSPVTLACCFLGGWALLVTGHKAFEKNSPALTSNLTHLMIGPLHLMLHLIDGQAETPPIPPHE